MSIDIPWVKLPKSQFEQLKNGTKGVIFRLSPQYVAKVLYSTQGSKENPEFQIRENGRALEELDYEAEINKKLYEAGIGNVPYPIGIEKLKLFGKIAFPAFIMEYLRIPRADELGHFNLGKATQLAKQEFEKAMDIGLLPGRDALNPGNFFYNPELNLVRLIDFGRWEYDSDFVLESN